MKQQNNMIVVGQTQPVGFGAVALFILCGTIAVIAQYFWQIIAFAACVLVIFVFCLLFGDQQLRRRELAMRADEQNRQFLEGDLRGLYGDATNEGPQ